MTHLAKLDRARKHLFDLESTIARWFREHPPRLVCEYDPKPPFPVGGSPVFVKVVLVASERPPVEIGLQIGDCVNNLRAALDHLIYGVARHHTGRAEIGDNVALQFPIYPDEQRFGAWRGRVRNLLPTSVLDWLESQQPYKDRTELPFDPRGSGFWVLSELCNADKHRVLATVTQAAVSDVRILGTYQIEGGAMRDVRVMGMFHDKQEVLGFPGWLPEDPNAEMHIKADCAGQIFFSKEGPGAGRPVLPTLHGLHDHLRDRLFPIFKPATK